MYSARFRHPNPRDLDLLSDTVLVGLDAHPSLPEWGARSRCCAAYCTTPPTLPHSLTVY